MTCGIFAIGYANPDSNVAGKLNKNTDIMASCWVEQTVERNRPAPSVVKR